jgi:hypothetical protein
MFTKHLRSLNPTEHSDQKVLRVALADKLDNVCSMVADYQDYRQKGKAEAFWDRFNAGKDDQLWFLKELLALLNGQLGDTMSLDSPIPVYFLAEFKEAVQELEKIE